MGKENKRMENFVNKINTSPIKKTNGPGDPESVFNKLKGAVSTVASYHPTVRVAKKGLDFVKSQIADNLNPQGYQKPVERITDAVLGRPAKNSYAAGRKGERNELLSLMMTGKQKHNMLPVSKYSPKDNKFFKNVKKGTTYYSSPKTEEYIRKTFMTAPGEKEWAQKKEFDKAMEEGKGMWLNEGGGGVLGKFTMYKGKDEKGEYIDYYDKWDLNPFEKNRGTMGKILDKGATTAQKLAGVKPAEVYGRVYYKK